MNNNDLNLLGSQIEDLIDQAIHSNNFHELNHSINHIIQDTVGDFKSSFMSEHSTPPSQPPRKKFTQYPPGQISGAFMMGLGLTFALILGGIGISTLIATILFHASFLISSVLLLLLCFCCLGTGIAGIQRLKRGKRFRQYRQILGNRDYCTLKELSERTGKSIRYVIKDLEDMFRRRYFLQGHIDDEKTCLMVSHEVFEQYRNMKQAQLEKQRLQEEERRKMDEAGMTPEALKLIEEGKSYIAYVRKCNDDLPGELISNKLSRLELVITRIFEEVKKRPELAPDLRKFMSYYLPTTKKLLNAYLEFERQEFQTPNVTSTKQEIEQTIDTINLAFENLLDSFFQDTAWDISSDISVLQSMFAQEGLTGNNFSKTRGHETDHL